MRIWTLHPSMLLETNNYVANWSETLQGLGALQGKHKMHLNHPQLNRFKRLNNILEGLNTYLYYLYIDSLKTLTITGKKFNFDIHKIDHRFVNLDLRLKVSQKQIDFELNHLNSKRIEKGLWDYDKSDVKLHLMFDIDNNYEDRIEKGDKI